MHPIVRAERPLLFGAIAAPLILSILPSSALSGHNYGSEVPIYVALGVQIISLFAGIRAIRWPRFFLLPLIFFALQILTSNGVASASLFPALIGPIVLLEYLFVSNIGIDHRRTLRNAIIWIASLEAVLGAIEALSHHGPFIGTAPLQDRFNPFEPTLYRAQGTLGSPLLLSFLLIVGLALLITASDLGARTRAIAFVAMAIGCFYTGSTTAIVLGAVIVIGAALLRRNIFWTLYAVFLAVIAAVVVIPSGRVQGFLGEDITQQTTSHRELILAQIPTLLTGRDVTRSLFGSGIGGAPGLVSAGLLDTGNFNALDNQLATSIVQTGIIGTAAMIAFLICVLVYAENWRSRFLVLIMVSVTFSFDFLSWYASATLFFACCALAIDPKQPAEAPAPVAIRASMRAVSS